MRFYRRNGRNMILTEGDAEAVPTRPTASPANQTLVEAIAKGHRWQAQLESAEYASPDDLAQAVGVLVRRCLLFSCRLLSCSRAALRHAGLEKLRKDLPVRWEEQREMWG